MSVETWHSEYMGEVFDEHTSPLKAAKLALKKWTGLLRKNLRKHNVKWLNNRHTHLVNDSFDMPCEPLKVVGSETCTLCKVHYKFEGTCNSCPLNKILGGRCDSIFVINKPDDCMNNLKSLYTIAKKNQKGVRLMIEYLTMALGYEMRREEERSSIQDELNDRT